MPDPNSRKLNLALDAGKKGDYNRAIKILWDIMSQGDAPPEAWLLLGRSYHAKKEYSHALAAFNDYIRFKPESDEGYLFAGRTYLVLGLAYKAVPLLRTALEKNFLNNAEEKKVILVQKQAEIKALLGTAYLKSRNSQAAVEVLQDAVESSPENKRIYRAYLNALLIRGVRLCGQGDHEAGLEMLRFVKANGEETGVSNSPFLLLVLGKAARETGNLEEALENFTSALELSKNRNLFKGGGLFTGEDPGIRWSRASVLIALGRNNEAGKDIEIIRSKDSGVPELPWNNELVNFYMVRSFMEKAQWKRAALACRDWLRSRDAEERPIIHALYAECLRNLKNYTAAKNHLRRALEIAPKELDFWYALVLVSWEAGDYDTLRRSVKSVSSLGGDDDIVKRFSVLCNVKISDDLQKNISLLQEAIRSFGPELELMSSLAEAYLKAGLLTEARNWYKKTISVYKNHEESWLGEIASLEAILTEKNPRQKTPKNELKNELKNIYREYLGFWPDNKHIRRDMALFLVKTSDFKEAIPELEKLLVLEPGNPSLRRVLAYSYRKTRRFREAASYLNTLLRESPRDIKLLLEYSGCLKRAGAKKYANALLEKALDWFTETAKKRPKDPRPREWIAKINEELGKNEAGKKNIPKNKVAVEKNL